MGPPTDTEQDQLLALREELARLRAEQRSFRDQVDRELVRRAYLIGKLEGELRDSNVAYESTLSWRVTKPLRALKLLLTELRR
jgi:hypothetical protein